LIRDEKTMTREPTFWASVDLVKAGYPVFPVGPDKNPSVAGGFYAATRDVSQIAEWITEGRENHDIAFPTGLVSLVVVIDVDTAEAYEKMHAHYGPPHANTQRGGHWYYRHPQDGKVTSAPLEPGLDCKGDGGYVVAPPSQSRSWTHGIPNLKTLPKLPGELRKAQDHRTDWRSRCGSASSVGEVIPGGRRNGTLTSLAGTMRRRGMGEEEIFAALEVTNRLRCKPPLEDEEVRRIVRSVAQYEPADAPWWVKVVAKNA
jgi:putative DNA primase/helicase